ncbi:uncharacterized protein CCR75_008297 [Bremia lactucae]|uniref:Uncharacterized protein n=1 Tax=Bremia lactucae TaxID=4779 RepID=A0A976NYN4_BRELC|nr:hypothetical protein CCR75_008297 [Bremia lactucae]
MTQPAPANWRSISQASPAVTAVKPRSTSGLSRSKSQPKKQCSEKLKPPVKPTPSVFELGIAHARTFVDSASPEQLEMRLQQLLVSKKFAEAAFIIAASPYLGSRFQKSDVVRLMLEKAKSPHSLEQAVRLVRILQLQSNAALITLIISEMVRALQFNAAVRLAQEMVPKFEQLSTSAERPCWTPPALIQAMIRAQKFRAALKFAKQFGLLGMFSAPQLVAGMLETRSWDEAVSSVMEMQLFQEFPPEALAVEMMRQRQWSQAVKCINKLSNTDDTQANLYEVLVRETARVGDFVTSLRYLREFKLDEGSKDSSLNLLRYVVDAMIVQKEFYKAIKYAIKFDLAKNPFNMAIAAAEAALTGANNEAMPTINDNKVEYLPQYNIELLIRKAMKCGQFHVATTFIKRLRLREKFADDIVFIENAQRNCLIEFRQYAQLRLAQFYEAGHQDNLKALLCDQAKDEMIELKPVQVEIVLEEEKEFFSRKQKNQHANTESEIKVNEIEFGAKLLVEEPQQQSVLSSNTEGQSRFGFARASSFSLHSDASVSVVDTSDEDIQLANQDEPQSTSPPHPDILKATESEGAQSKTNDNTTSFNFADFAKSVRGCEPFPLPQSALHHPPQPPQLSQQQPLVKQQQEQAKFKSPMPICNSFFATGPPRYSMPPMIRQQPPLHCAPLNASPDGMQVRGYPQPPPPPPSQTNSGGGAFDVASLAMQFHKSSPDYGNFVTPRPNVGYPRASQLGQQFSSGMPQFPSPPPQPHSTFKPSMSFTSVTTTRQKK